jgi:hypothetical protein
MKWFARRYQVEPYYIRGDGKSEPLRTITGQGVKHRRFRSALREAELMNGLAVTQAPRGFARTVRYYVLDVAKEKK